MKGKVSPELLKKIKDSVNIVDVIGEHVVLKKSGSNYTGLCPFHSERTPSFSVSESKQLYHCYGCKKGGDLVSFVMEIHGLSFPEALQELGERGGLNLPELKNALGSGTPEQDQRRKAALEKTALAYKLNRFVAAYYHQLLSKNPAARVYLSSRGVSPELVRSFYLGVSQPEWEGLALHLVSKKAPLPLAAELGLIRNSTKGSQSKTGYFDLFRNRVMFPILNMRGKVAGFGGRILASGDEGPKYLNSSESVVFQKSKLIFGLYQAQKHIREKDEVIIVEGYFDVLALHAAGFENVVSTCGTALTSEHLAILKRFASRVVILFDGDKAGISATERAMELGLEQGMILYTAVVPEGMDPDEILFESTGKPKAGGKEQLASLLGISKPLLDERIDLAIESSLKGPEARSQAIKRMAGWLNLYKDPVGKEVRVRTILSRMGNLVSRELLGQKSVSGGIRESRRPVPPVSKKVSSVGSSSPSSNDRLILSAIARGGEEFAELLTIRDRLPPETGFPDLLEYPFARDLIGRLLLSCEPSELPKLLTETDFGPGLDPQVRSILTEAWVTEGETPMSPPLADLNLAINRALHRIWAQFSQRIKMAVAAAEAKKDAGLHSKLMKEYLDVQRKMKEFNSFYDEA